MISAFLLGALRTLTDLPLGVFTYMTLVFADAAVTKVNDAETALDTILLTDDDGGGYTYYKLRDLGRKLGFNVGWTAERGIFLETDKAYEG